MIVEYDPTTPQDSDLIFVVRWEGKIIARFENETYAYAMIEELERRKAVWDQYMRTHGHEPMTGARR